MKCISTHQREESKLRVPDILTLSAARGSCSRGTSHGHQPCLVIVTTSSSGQGCALQLRRQQGSRIEAVDSSKRSCHVSNGQPGGRHGTLRGG